MRTAHRFVVLLIIVCLPALSLGSPIVDRQFDGNFNDDAGGSTIVVHPDCPADPCNSSSIFDTDEFGTFWQWESENPRGGGFTLRTNVELGDTFTIRLVFSFDEVSSFRKIIDFKDRESDNGLYFNSGYIRFWPLSRSGETFMAGEVLELVVARNGIDNQLVVFVVDGNDTFISLDMNDTADLAIATTDAGESILGFFHDDIATASEGTSGGKVYLLQILDRFEPLIFRSRFEG